MGSRRNRDILGMCVAVSCCVLLCVGYLAGRARGASEARRAVEDAVAAHRQDLADIVQWVRIGDPVPLAETAAVRWERFKRDHPEQFMFNLRGAD